MAKPIHTDFDFNNASKVINLPNPTAAQDAATKAYVDSAVEGIAWKDAAVVSTQGNINLASPGATIDGITMATNDIIRNFDGGSSHDLLVSLEISVFNGGSSADLV